MIAGPILEGVDMYCPNCSSHNQPDVKFCNRCGTNLSVVADALAAKVVADTPAERNLKLLKDYYEGRKATIVGIPFIAVGVLVLTLLLGAGMPEKLSVVALLALAGAVYGAVIAIWGISTLVECTSEMKAIEQATKINLLARPAEGSAVSPTNPQLAERAPGYTTDSIVAPGSVTEQTTRQLEGRSFIPGQSKQSN